MRSLNLVPPFLLLFSVLIGASSATPTYPQFLGRFSHRKSRTGDSNSYSYETKYYTQRLDHFSFIGDTQGDSSFQQRYLLGSPDKWARPGGPIFFYCGNEGDIVWFAENTGFVWEIAPRFNALVIFAEVCLLLLEEKKGTVRLPHIICGKYSFTFGAGGN
jgi:lysosomal Pro-X carboxypeptidase